MKEIESRIDKLENDYLPPPSPPRVTPPFMECQMWFRVLMNLTLPQWGYYMVCMRTGVDRVYEMPAYGLYRYLQDNPHEVIRIYSYNSHEEFLNRK